MRSENAHLLTEIFCEGNKRAKNEGVSSLISAILFKDEVCCLCVLLSDIEPLRQ